MELSEPFRNLERESVQPKYLAEPLEEPTGSCTTREVIVPSCNHTVIIIPYRDEWLFQSSATSKHSPNRASQNVPITTRNLLHQHHLQQEFHPPSTVSSTFNMQQPQSTDTSTFYRFIHLNQPQSTDTSTFYSFIHLRQAQSTASSTFDSLMYLLLCAQYVVL